MSLKVFIAHSGGRGDTGHPLRARDKAAIALLVLLVVAVTVGLFLAFAVVGLILAVPVLIAAGVGALLRRRNWRAGKSEIIGALPPADEAGGPSPTGLAARDSQRAPPHRNA
jgi:hypothetical protein